MLTHASTSSKAQKVEFMQHFYVYKNLRAGNPEAIVEAAELLQENGLLLNILDGLQDYFLVKYKESFARSALLV